MADPEISPSDLKFRFQLNKTLPATINIHNPHKQRLAFKVKTTTPKKYCVKPSSGSVEPHGSTIVQVSMQASKEMPADLNNCKDKFLIQTVLLNPGEEVLGDSFKKENKNLREIKLRVILEGPPAPPSPVPEANEGEEDASSEFKTFTTVKSSSNGTEYVAPPAAITTAPVSVAPSSVKASTLTQPAPSSVSAELTSKYEKLRVEYDRSERERKELASKVERLSLSAAKATVSTPKSPMAKAMQDKRWTLLQLILVAIVAFLLGHFT